MARSHHRGDYRIVNGSDKEPGGVRRGPSRKRHKKTLFQRLAERAKKILVRSVKKAVTDRVTAAVEKKVKKLLKPRAARSHHLGSYTIANGSAAEGKIRRGPRRKFSESEKTNQRRARWREKSAAKRGK